MTITVTGDRELDRFFGTLTAKLQRGAIRKGVSAAGSALVKEIRTNISRMVSSESEGRARRAYRLDRRGKKTSLKKSVGKRAWSRPRRGLIGQVVGPRWPEGAHGHLVEFGHEVVSHGLATGRRTRPKPFQRAAQRSAKGAIIAAQRVKLKQALNTLRAKRV